MLLKAFPRAFRPDDGVGLVIKEMGAKSFYRGQTAGSEIAAMRERGYAVEYIDHVLSEAEMAALYCSCDALVQPFRREGFGLPIIEAKACGLPVIITGAGPALVYASDKTAYFIPAERRPLGDPTVDGMETIGQPWMFEPDADALVELMKRVVSGRDDAQAIGTATSDHMREHFTWARTVEAVEQRLWALTRRPVRTLTRSASEGLYRPSAESSTTRTRSASDGLHETREEREHPQPAGDCAAVLNGESCEPGQMPGTVAGSAGWAANARERMPILANASGWYVEPPSIVLKSRSAASVSLTIIVKNEQENLPRCLASVVGIFDEIIIVDTGSVDRTKEIARAFGARMFDFEWVDDFAAGRNEALSHATGNYAFWLDAEDVVEPAERTKLLKLLGGLSQPQDVPAAYVVRCACAPSPDGKKGATVVDHVRLFPIRPGVRWAYRVHEQILPSLKRANIAVRWTDLTVRHTGYLDPGVEARKLDRNIRLLKLEVEERPDDPFVLFNLGMSAGERRELPEALAYLTHSLAGSAPSDSIVCKLFALIARTHQMMGDSQAALATCARGLELMPAEAELWFRKGIVHRHRGESSEAERCWRLIFKLARPDQFRSVDPGIYGHLTRRNLAALAAERGDSVEMRRLWEEVLAECPGDREALTRLGRLDQKALTVQPSR